MHCVLNFPDVLIYKMIIKKEGNEKNPQCIEKMMHERYNMLQR